MSTTPTPPTGLARVLGPVTATAVVVGTVIGSGVFIKPSTIARDVPHFGLVALAWVIGGLLVILGALVYAEVAIVLPRAGGNYVFLREGYGRLAGFLWGWVDFWIIRTGSIAALATIFASSLADVLANPRFQQAVGLPATERLGFWGQRAVTVGVILGLGVVNIRGVRWGGGLQVFLTLLKVGGIVAMALLPWWLFAREAPLPDAQMPSAENLGEVWPATWRTVALGGFISALLAIQWPYHGWMNIAPIAGEIKQPGRNIPVSLLLGVGIIIALYLSVNYAYYLALSGEEMKKLPPDTNVATAFASRLVGPLGAAAVSLVIMCSVFGSLNGNILVGPRLLYAMGEDGLAPRWLRGVHPSWGTPAAAIAVLSAWAALQVLSVAILGQFGVLKADKSAFDTLTDFAMFGAIIFETLAVLSIFVFRRTMPDAPRPYRCPAYPWLPAAYAVVPAVILVNMFLEQPFEALVGLGFIALGVAVYFALGLSGTGAPPPREPLPELAPGDKAPLPVPSEGITDPREAVRP